MKHMSTLPVYPAKPMCHDQITSHGWAHHLGFTRQCHSGLSLVVQA